MVVPLTFGGVMDAAGAEKRTGIATATATAAAAAVAAKTVQVLDSPIIGTVPFFRAPRTPTVCQMRQGLRRFAGYAGGSWCARAVITITKDEDRGRGWVWSWQVLGPRSGIVVGVDVRGSAATNCVVSMVPMTATPRALP
jgi:hypothetical protein